MSENIINTYRQDNCNITVGAKNPIKEWTIGVEVEDQARLQLVNAANLPFIYKYVVGMPDMHAGIGCTVGSVIPTVGAIVPSFVGVDIGCGVIAQKTTLKRSMLPNSLRDIRLIIEKAIPHGFETKGRDNGSWGNPPAEVNIAWTKLVGGYEDLIKKHPKCSHKNPCSQLGTLGSGNHLYEICYDENEEIWLLLHSGSRGPGNKIGQFFINLAKQDMKDYFIELSDNNLAYFPKSTDHFNDYWNAVIWAQEYALINRQLMVDLSYKALKKSNILPKFELTDDVVQCHHNYVTVEQHFGRNVYVTRKGAISAKKDELGVILASMGTPSRIVRGLGNFDSFMSASHGAGRRMSRTEAFKTFTLQDHAKAVKGVECRVDKDILDETPAAYKDIDQVMNAQSDLVESIHFLKQVVCVKG
ncbi:MAG: RtcB family protein [Clostridia bacterium]|jgi:tRNA-splicing ligase RtcB